MGKHPLPTQTGATPGTEVHNTVKEMAFMILLSQRSLELKTKAGTMFSDDDYYLCAQLWHAFSGYASAFAPSLLSPFQSI